MHFYLSKNAMLQYFGWTTFQISIMLIFWNVDIWQSSPADSINVSFLYFTVLAAYALSFLLYSAFFFVVKRKPHTKTTFVTVCIALAISALMVFALNFGIPYFATISALLVGIVAAGLFILWLQKIANNSLLISGAIIILATMTSAIIYLIIQIISPEQLFMSIVNVCFGLSCVLYFAINKVTDDVVQHGAFNASADVNYAKADSCRKSTVSFLGLVKALWQPAICVAFLGFTWEFTTEYGFKVIHGGIPFQILSIVNILSTFLLFIIWLKFYSKLQLIVLYQVLFPVMATVILLMPFLDSPLIFAILTISNSIFCIVSILMMITCIQIGERLNVDVGVTVGLFAGFVFSFMLCGYLVGYLVFRNVPSTPDLLLIAMMAVYACSMIMFVTKANRDKDLAAGSGHSNEPSTSSSDELANYSPSDLSGETTIAQEPLDSSIDQDSFDLACNQIASQYGLTSREVEVLQLLARGRDLPYISEKLTISKNTIRTHSKNIYSKMGVHKKQELIDIVDAACH